VSRTLKRKALPALVCPILQPDEQRQEGFSLHQSGLEVWLWQSNLCEFAAENGEWS